ncbi:MAG: glycosyltransferase family 2 protein [Oscillospiraceae bacterium]|nr:glycosyltransferase family 2 protein [Oscillospiraceae bacterium]
MKQELISVIVPVYNVEPYLDKCIQSICTQSYQNLEIILSDDGSTDSSGIICDAWAEKDIRIRVTHKENGGLSDARNAGIDIATGDWYVFVDSDDFLAEDAIESMYAVAKTYNCQMAVCNMLRIYEDGEMEAFYCPVTELTVLQGNERFETLKQPSVCNKLFRADLFGEVRFPKGKFYEDTFVYHILAHRADGIALTGRVGYYYLSRRNSILGRQVYTDRYFDRIEAVYRRMSYLIENQIPHYAEEACESLYVDVCRGSTKIPRTEANREKFQQMWAWFQVAYDHLMHHSATSTKMKLRLVLLKKAPWLHELIY